MRIITIAVVPNGLTGILGVQVLTAIEKEKYVLYSVIVGAVLDFALNILLIPQFGAMGAALATTIAEFAVLAVQLLYTRNLMCQIRSQLKWKSYIILSAIAAIFGCLTQMFQIKSTFLELVVSAFTFFCIYGVGLLVAKDSFAMEAVKWGKAKLRRIR